MSKNKSSTTRSTHSPRAQVNEALAALILRCQPGQQLPPEPQLAQQLGVSRATLRETLRSFEEHGQLVRRHGVGTFVAPSAPLIETGLEELESLHTLAQRSGLDIHMGNALIEERTALPGEAERLQISPDSLVLYVARVMLTKTQPVAYLVDVLPAARLRQIDLGEAFNGSVLDRLIERGDPPLSHSRTDIVAEAAHGAVARQLGVARGEVLLKLEAQLIARDGQIVDDSLSYFVPGYLRFHVVRRVGKSESNNKSQISNLKNPQLLRLSFS